MLLEQIVRGAQVLPTGAATNSETRNLVSNSIMVRTDADGQVFPAFPLQTGEYRAELNFLGDGVLAPCRSRFLFDVA